MKNKPGVYNYTVVSLDHNTVLSLICFLLGSRISLHVLHTVENKHVMSLVATSRNKRYHKDDIKSHNTEEHLHLCAVNMPSHHVTVIVNC